MQKPSDALAANRSIFLSQACQVLFSLVVMNIILHYFHGPIQIISLSVFPSRLTPGHDNSSSLQDTHKDRFKTGL